MGPQYMRLMPHIPSEGTFVAEDICTKAHMTLDKARHALYLLARKGLVKQLPKRPGETLRFQGVK